MGRDPSGGGLGRRLILLDEGALGPGRVAHGAREVMPDILGLGVNLDRRAPDRRGVAAIHPDGAAADVVTGAGDVPGQVRSLRGAAVSGLVTLLAGQRDGRALAGEVPVGGIGAKGRQEQEQGPGGEAAGVIG